MKTLLTTLTNIMAFVLLTGPMVALAQYDYQLVDHPGTLDTQVFGINDRGDVVGNGIDDPSFPFVYASKKDRYTDVAPVAGYDNTGVLGISDKGVLVGSVTKYDPDPLLDETSGLIINKKGASTLFDHPDALLYTTARGVNDKGLVTGFRNKLHPTLDFLTWFAFVYDLKSDTFTDIIPESDHERSIAQGINSKGEVVGSAFFFGANDPCNPGNTDFVRYGWWRATDGTVTYFQVNGQRTAARGINDSGTIVGFAEDPVDGNTKGFKVELDGSQCQAITIASGDLLEFPGYVGLYPQDISNDGVIVGGADEWDGVGFIFHGFMATPQ